MTCSESENQVGYEQRLRALRRQIERLDRCQAELEEDARRVVRWRLVSFALLLGGSAAALLALGQTAFVVVGLTLLFVFFYWVWRHRKIESSALRLRILQQIKRDQAARMLLDWDHIPPAEPLDERFEHPYGLDLDIVGERSLQRVIDLSITKEGSDRLRRWLLAFEPDLEALPARQNLVRELIHLPVLSTRLTLSALIAAGHDGSETPSRWSSAQLLDWVNLKSDTGTLRAALIGLLILALLNFFLLIAYLQDWIPPLFLITWFIYGAVTISQMRHVAPVFQESASISDNLRQLEAVFSSLKSRSFAKYPHLQSFTGPLRKEGQSLEEMLSRTNRLLAAAGLRYNPFAAFLINALFPLDVLVAYRLEGLKQELSGILPGWLAMWHDLEALGSLANFAYLYPAAAFAEISSVNKAGSPFSGRGLGHPLIKEEDRVCNDFTMDRLGSLVMITGSNMAGKSTFLRTLGMNACLALSGAPVLARSLSLIPMRVFASITVTDSVTDGFSFFYAEVRRLKMLLDALQDPQAAPLFFLIDEIFRGTNNRERLIGSSSFVNALIGENGCGAIATHDLDLVVLAQDNTFVSNYHFRDDVRNGRMEFDYKIHPGPCPTTNALRIMELAGLPVENPEGAGS
jgi:hypothetical protein